MEITNGEIFDLLGYKVISGFDDKKQKTVYSVVCPNGRVVDTRRFTDLESVKEESVDFWTTSLSACYGLEEKLTKEERERYLITLAFEVDPGLMDMEPNDDSLDIPRLHWAIRHAKPRQCCWAWAVVIRARNESGQSARVKGKGD